MLSVMLLGQELTWFCNTVSNQGVCWGFYGRSGGTSIGAFPQDPAKLVDMRSLERRDLWMRFWSGRLFLMFCSCFEVDNDSKDTGNANR